MKYLLFLSLISSSLYAGECKLTGITQACQKYETKFETGNMNACLELGKKTISNKFFNFIESDDLLIKTTVSFKEDSIEKDELNFSDEEGCI